MRGVGGWEGMGKGGGLRRVGLGTRGRPYRWSRIPSGSVMLALRPKDPGIPAGHTAEGSPMPWLIKVQNIHQQLLTDARIGLMNYRQVQKKRSYGEQHLDMTNIFVNASVIRNVG